MTALSNYIEEKFIDHVLGNGSAAYATPTYVALLTSDPGETGSLAGELSGGSYARQSATAAFATASGTGGVHSNSAAISFSLGAITNSTITHVAIVDGSTVGAGNVLLHGSLNPSKAVSSGDTVQFAVGDLDITFD